VQKSHKILAFYFFFIACLLDYIFLCVIIK